MRGHDSKTRTEGQENRRPPLTLTLAVTGPSQCRSNLTSGGKPSGPCLHLEVPDVTYLWERLLSTASCMLAMRRQSTKKSTRVGETWDPPNRQLPRTGTGFATLSVNRRRQNYGAVGSLSPQLVVQPESPGAALASLGSLWPKQHAFAASPFWESEMG